MQQVNVAELKSSPSASPEPSPPDSPARASISRSRNHTPAHADLQSPPTIVPATSRFVYSRTAPSSLSMSGMSGWSGSPVFADELSSYEMRLLLDPLRFLMALRCMTDERKQKL